MVVIATLRGGRRGSRWACSPLPLVGLVVAPGFSHSPLLRRLRLPPLLTSRRKGLIRPVATTVHDVVTDNKEGWAAGTKTGSSTVSSSRARVEMVELLILAARVAEEVEGLQAEHRREGARNMLAAKGRSSSKAPVEAVELLILAMVIFLGFV